MQTSNETNEIISALQKVNLEIENPVAVADNPFYKSKYTPLDYLINHVKKVITKHGLFIIQEAIIVDSITRVETMLIHISGQWIKTFMDVPRGTDPQKQGAAVTYARRYALSAMFNIASDMDNDANETVEKDKLDSMPQYIRQLFIDRGYKDRKAVRAACESCNYDWNLIKQSLEV